MTSSRSQCLVVTVLAVAAIFLYSSSMQPVSAQAEAPGVSPACDTVFTFQNGSQKTFTLCQNLVIQNATLAWTYFPGDNTSGTVTGGVLDLAFTSTLLSSGGWVGWGLNPTPDVMMGASVLVAFTDSSAGSVVLPYFLGNDLTVSSPPPLVSGATDLDVLDSSVNIDATTLQTTIYATLQLKPGETNVYQVWNKGPSVDGRSPNTHDIVSNTYLTSVGVLDVVTGTVVTGASTPAIQNIHGILNAISWGVLFPVGIMSARYMKPFALFDPIWFYLHVGCQLCGYILGVAGFATGVKIIDPTDVKYKHRNLGIALFVFATLQIASLLLRPGPKHQLRKFWKVTHYAFGYAVIVLSIINIFEGFNLLLPAEGWKRAYIGVIVALAGIALILEVFTWSMWLRRKFRAKNLSTTARDSSSADMVEKGGFAPDSKLENGSFAADSSKKI